MSHFTHYRCTQCGKEYQRDEVRYLCPVCAADYHPGMPLKGVLEAYFDYAAIGAEVADTALDSSAFCDAFSAVEPIFYPPMPVGNTPFFEVTRLGEQIGLKRLYIKNDGVNPSGSFKDRASHLVVAEATRLGLEEIVTASTGNAASSLSALCASAGKRAVIFAPETAPVAKLIQIQIHGATLHKVKGTYDEAFRQALEYSDTHDCLNRNTAYHPLTIEGKKTAGLEIYLQNQRQVPDWIAIPVGDGVILAGIHKAFVDLLRVGLIDRLPRLLAVQAASSDAITSYYETKVYHDAIDPATVADSISVTTPSNAHWAVSALLETDGRAVRVPDRNILLAQRQLAQSCGVFAEPSSATTLAGVQTAIANGWIKQDEQVVLLITGHGLKDINAVKL